MLGGKDVGVLEKKKGSTVSPVYFRTGARGQEPRDGAGPIHVKTGRSGGDLWLRTKH